MKQSFLIPGEGFGPSPFPQPPQPVRSTRLFRFLLSVWVVAGLTFVVIKLLPGKRESAPAAQATPAPTAISTEDLLRHMEAVNRRLAESAAKIRQAEDQIDRAIPALDRNYLPIEAQRLKHAAAVAEGARRDLEDGREEFQLVLNSLRKDDHTQ
jgi:hypothetical protein